MRSFHPENPAPDAQYIKGTSLIGTESGPPCLVDVKEGKIVRIRPFPYERSYDKSAFHPWSIQARGQEFTPPLKSILSPFGLAYKKRVYSKNRILYPMKRVDWDPNGERNPQNRGKSKYARISWDEAARLVADELRRVGTAYGPEAVLAQADMHGEGKHIAPSHGCMNRLLSLLGGYTVQMRNHDSWEGWYWGAKHVWGCEPVGEMTPAGNLIPDIAQNADMLLFWGCDPETTPLGINGMMASRLCYWFTDLGIRSVYICPDLNYGAAVHADKWIPIYPNTDSALQLAIAYVWMTEDLYDKEYIATHAYGFEKFEAYVLGKRDGIPKTPAWASGKCGVKEWTIKALARDWAGKAVSIMHGNGGPAIRSPYATEFGRLEPMLLGMQGLGKPGVHQAKMIEWNLFSDNQPMPHQGTFRPIVPRLVDTIRPADGDAQGQFALGRTAPSPELLERVPEMGEVLRVLPPPVQSIPRCLVNEAILNPPVSWYGMGYFFAHADEQFVKYTFPKPGRSGIHMIWTDSPCSTTCWNDSNNWIRAMTSPQIECIVAQHPWMENDCLFADIILPVCTRFEMSDIGEDNGSGVFTSVFLEEQCCPAQGESMSDFDVVARIARELGLYEEYTAGKTVEDKLELCFRASQADRLLSWEEFREKRYVVLPCDQNVQKDVPPGLRQFYETPKEHPLSTPTGLLEYSSSALEKQFPDDPERPPVAGWVETGLSHDERLSSERAAKYPLLCMSNHGRWRMHAQCDDITWMREIGTMKVRGKDGYQYEPVWINPAEAGARGIRHGDIVKVYNERGAVLGGAYVTERVNIKTISMDHGSRLDPIIPGVLDRGGAINTLTPGNPTSKHATGMVVSSFLVQVEKVTDEEMERWKLQYPEAFARKIDNETGICLASWMEAGEGGGVHGKEEDICI